MSTEFFIGRYDLNFLDDFYPDDLPTEWRFDFYANTFNSVLLPLDTTEDIESILEELGDDFYLVFEVSDHTLTQPQQLEEVLALTQGHHNIIFWFKITKKPNTQLLTLFKGQSVVFQSQSNIAGMPKDYQHHQLANQFIYYNKTPVLVSSLALSDKEIRQFIESLTSINQKIVLICRSAEGTHLEKAKLIAQMLGY